MTEVVRMIRIMVTLERPHPERRWALNHQILAMDGNSVVMRHQGKKLQLIND